MCDLDKKFEGRQFGHGCALTEGVKILSQTAVATTMPSGNSVPAGNNKADFQSTFAAAVGAAAPAGSENGPASHLSSNLSSQGVKSQVRESKKKSDASDAAAGASNAQAPNKTPEAAVQPPVTDVRSTAEAYANLPIANGVEPGVLQLQGTKDTAGAVSDSGMQVALRQATSRSSDASMVQAGSVPAGAARVLQNDPSGVLSQVPTPTALPQDASAARPEVAAPVAGDTAEQPVTEPSFHLPSQPSTESLAQPAAQTLELPPLKDAPAAQTETVVSLPDAPKASVENVRAQPSIVAPSAAPAVAGKHKPELNTATHVAAEMQTDARSTDVAKVPTKSSDSAPAPTQSNAVPAAKLSSVVAGGLDAPHANASTSAAVVEPAGGTVPAGDASAAAQAVNVLQQSTAAPSLLPQVSGPGSVQESSSVPAASAFSASAPSGPTTAAAALNRGGGSVKGKASPSNLKSVKSGAENEAKQTSTEAVGGSFASRVTAASAGGQEAADSHKGVGTGAAPAQSTLAGGAALPGEGQPSPREVSQGAGLPSTTPTAAQASSANEAQAASALSNAQVIQTTHGSEMRLGMKSAEFGDISISTTMNHQAITAQISIDHSALGHALAVHLPAIEQKLGTAYGLQARVEVRDSGNSSSSNDSGRESRPSQQSRGAAGQSNSAASDGPMSAHTSSPYASTAASSSRLDIRI
jgi:hypothetical protein